MRQRTLEMRREGKWRDFSCSEGSGGGGDGWLIHFPIIHNTDCRVASIITKNYIGTVLIDLFYYFTLTPLQVSQLFYHLATRISFPASEFIVHIYFIPELFPAPPKSESLFLWNHHLSARFHFPAVPGWLNNVGSSTVPWYSPLGTLESPPSFLTTWLVPGMYYVLYIN